MKIPTYEEIKPYITEGLISEQIHPEDQHVRIFNYTQECQFAQKWDDVTLQCRGLILNVHTGECLARPFPKFFNYEEMIAKGMEVKIKEPLIVKKYDGSLGILYWLNGKPWIATRGSFTSEQAVWATNWIRKYVGTECEDFFFSTAEMEKSYTHLFEIIYPENRIVVNYDFSGLVYLGSLHIPNSMFIKLLPPTVIKSAEVISSHDWKTLGQLSTQNEEGFVVHCERTGQRLKIKFAEYVRLHKVMTGLSAIGIWESLAEEKPITLDNVPDEFFNWFTETKNRISDDYEMIAEASIDHFARIQELMDSALVGGGNRKEWAEQIKKMKYPGIGFAMLDNKPYSQIIWKMVRPKGQSVFKNDIDS